MPQSLNSLADVTDINILINLLSYLWPLIVLPNLSKSPLNPKMTSVPRVVMIDP